MSAMSYTIGILPLNDADGASGTKLDMHFFNALNFSSTMMGVSVGMSNGDFIGMLYDCKYRRWDVNCTDMSLVVSGLRSTATNQDFINYGTTLLSDGSRVHVTHMLNLSLNPLQHARLALCLMRSLSQCCVVSV